MHILLVEDSTTDAILIKREIARSFQNRVYNISVAMSKVMALAMLSEYDFDIVLLDLTLPDAMRLEGLIELQAAYPKVPVVVLTGYEDYDFALEAVSSGAQDYLLKNKIMGDAIKHSLDYAIQRKLMEVELQAARLEAENASRAKSEFLAAMSHELRTPLNAISGFAQMLVMLGAMPKTEKEVGYAKDIIAASDHLLRLINDILDLAKIEAGKMSLEIKPLSINKILAELKQFMTPMTEAKSIHLEITADTECEVMSDHVRLLQVLINLSSNAVKYNRTGGRVVVHAQASGRMLKISVTDNGHGIQAARQAEIFQPFNRLGSEKTNVEGTGIGLAICKNMMTEMDGAIGFESTEGQGSCFWVKVPLADETVH